VDKKGKFFKKVMLKRLWQRSFNLFLLVWENILKGFYFCGRLPKRNILYIGMKRAPFSFGRNEFYFWDFWELRFSFYDILITIFPRVFIVREVNLMDVVFELKVPLNLVGEILCFL
jgi:hypothetical protein